MSTKFSDELIDLDLSWKVYAQSFHDGYGPTKVRKTPVELAGAMDWYEEENGDGSCMHSSTEGERSVCYWVDETEVKRGFRYVATR